MDAKELKSYLKESELDIQNANAALFLADYIFGFYANSHKLHGVNFSPVCSYFSYSKLSAFYQIINKKFIVDLSEKIYKNFKKNRKSFEEMVGVHQNLTRKFDLTWREYQKAKKQGLSEKILGEFYRKFENISRSYWYNAVACEDKGAIIEREIIPSFARRNNLSVEKAQNIVTILSHPDEQSVFNFERKEFLQICLLIFQKKLIVKTEEDIIAQVLGDKELKNKINSYVRHYFWVKTDFYRATEITKDSLIKDIIQELKKKSKKEIEKELLDIDKNFERIGIRKKKILRDSRLKREDMDELYFSRKTIYWMDQRKMGMMKNIYYVFSLLGDIAACYDIDYANIILYSTEDLDRLLLSGRKLDKKILAKRHAGTFMSCERGEITKFFYGNVGEEMFKIATNVEKKELKGIVASKGSGGIVRGKVKIVLNPKEISFHTGEILVTSMTRVEFVPLMRKARAIITNEGGLACHAAIISRELGIPAIIGTKNATNILKNGDEIEMDMKTGEIRVVILVV
ncbi:MAG: PEP-utilizing enzyme [Candidatus Moraniibacteriota bacterium]